MKQFDVLCFLEVFLYIWGFFEADSIDFGCEDAIDFVVEVLKLFAELPVGGFVVLD